VKGTRQRREEKEQGAGIGKATNLTLNFRTVRGTAIVGPQSNAQQKP